MNIKRDFAAEKPRAQVWCVSGDLEPVDAGVFRFKDGTDPGEGSEVVVMDQQGAILFCHDGKLIVWSGSVAIEEAEK